MSGELLWSEEQSEFGKVLRQWFAAHQPLSRTRALAEAGERHDPAVWQSLAQELGAHGLTFPEKYGGSGASRRERAVLAAEMGRVLHGGPFLSTVVLAAEAILRSGDVEAQNEYLPVIGEGALTATLAYAGVGQTWDATKPGARANGDRTRLTGSFEFVLDGAGADVFVVAALDTDGRASLYLVDGAAPGVTRTPLEVLDLTREVARVGLDDVPARLLGVAGGANEVVGAVLEEAAIFLAAEQVGGTEALLGIASEYSKTRVQFGRPIGSYQGVKHKVADVLVALDQARSAAMWAAWQQPGSDEAFLGSAVARSWCSETFLNAAFDTIQVLGGIGFTWEHDAHYFVRRARADASLIGDPQWYRERLAYALFPMEVTR